MLGFMMAGRKFMQNSMSYCRTRYGGFSVWPETHYFAYPGGCVLNLDLITSPAASNVI